MRTKILAAILVVLSIAATGCVQFHSDLTIDAKGGGTATASLAVGTEVLAALDELGKTGGIGGGQDMPDFNDITRAKFEKRAAGRGVTITSFEKGEVAGKQTLSFALTFADLKGLSYVLGDLAASSGGEGLGIFGAEGGNLALRAARYDFPAEPKDAKDDAPATEPTPEQMARQMELAGTLMGALAEMDVVLKVTVPGDVVSSNAPTVEGRTSTWAINAENMMEQQNDPSPQIVFAGKGLSIKPLKE